MNDFALLLPLQDVARRVAREEVLPRFRHVTAVQKSDGGLLTEADVAAQQALAVILPGLAPYPVLGEEMTSDEQQALWRDNQAGLWVVDPIDGTTNFARGLPCFSISIALMRAGRPVLGVVYAPVLNECFSAAAGHGAWCNEARLHMSNEMPLSMAVAAVDSKRLPASMAQYLVSERPVHSVRNFGSSTLDWCWLATGSVDVMLHGGQKLWDFAAGALILQEAGGCLTTLEGEDFWAAEPWQRSVIAARSPELFLAWKSWVKSCRMSEAVTRS